MSALAPIELLSAAAQAIEPAAGQRAWLEIDLDAIAANYRNLRGLYRGRELGAVVKMDAYGLGLVPIAARLAAEGCRLFWVADLEEGARLRMSQPKARIFVLNGLGGRPIEEHAAHELIPVLSSRQEVEESAAAPGGPWSAAILLDCGLTRLGLTEADVAALRGQVEVWEQLHVAAWLTQLAFFERPDDPANRAQVVRFRKQLQGLPPAPWSLACSAAVFMEPLFHGELGRVGSALYGVQGTPGHLQPLLRPVRALARVVRVTEVPAGTSVGYGGHHVTTRPSRIATLAAGYANGVPVRLAGRGQVSFAGTLAPIIGRISMSLMMVDTTELPSALVFPEALAELVGSTILLEDCAAQAGTVANETLVGLGHGLPRLYRGGVPSGS